MRRCEDKLTVNRGNRANHTVPASVIHQKTIQHEHASLLWLAMHDTVLYVFAKGFPRNHCRQAKIYLPRCLSSPGPTVYMNT